MATCSRDAGQLLDGFRLQSSGPPTPLLNTALPPTILLPNTSRAVLSARIAAATHAGPIVIPNALGSLHFDRSTLRHLCATPEGSSLTMAVSPRAKVGRSWAGLQFVGASTFGVDSVASLLDAHERGDLEGAVLFDSPCASACPGALRMSNASAATGPLPAPRYFPVDYSAALEGPRGVGVRTKTDPDLFVSRAGTSTHVHVDSGCTRFYMLQLYGRKLWRVFAPEEDANLHRAANGHFEADVLRPDAARWPGLARVRRAHEFVLHPGELVLIPESWSHAVHNLDDTSALLSEAIRGAREVRCG